MNLRQRAEQYPRIDVLNKPVQIAADKFSLQSALPSQKDIRDMRSSQGDERIERKGRKGDQRSLVEPRQVVELASLKIIDPQPPSSQGFLCEIPESAQRSSQNRGLLTPRLHDYEFQEEFIEDNNEIDDQSQGADRRAGEPSALQRCEKPALQKDSHLTSNHRSRGGNLVATQGQSSSGQVGAELQLAEKTRPRVIRQVEKWRRNLPLKNASFFHRFGLERFINDLSYGHELGSESIRHIARYLSVDKSYRGLLKFLDLRKLLLEKVLKIAHGSLDERSGIAPRAQSQSRALPERTQRNFERKKSEYKLRYH